MAAGQAPACPRSFAPGVRCVGGKPGRGGNGGTGGVGAVGGAGVIGSAFTLTNHGRILGGEGGMGGEGGDGGMGGQDSSGTYFSGIYDGARGSSGTGGIRGPGVVSYGNATIVNYGFIAGGAGGVASIDNSQVRSSGGTAVMLTGGGNRLVLAGDNWSLGGTVTTLSGTANGGDVLEFQPGSNVSRSVSWLNNTFVGFTGFVASGPGVLTLDAAGGAGTYVGRVELRGGGLGLASGVGVTGQAGQAGANNSVGNGYAGGLGGTGVQATATFADGVRTSLPTTLTIAGQVTGGKGGRRRRQVERRRAREPSFGRRQWRRRRYRRLDDGGCGGRESRWGGVGR